MRFKSEGDAMNNLLRRILHFGDELADPFCEHGATEGGKGDDVLCSRSIKELMKAARVVLYRHASTDKIFIRHRNAIRKTLSSRSFAGPKSRNINKLHARAKDISALQTSRKFTCRLGWFARLKLDIAGEEYDLGTDAFVQQILISVNPDGIEALSSLEEALRDIESSLEEISDLLADRLTALATTHHNSSVKLLPGNGKSDVPVDSWRLDQHVIMAAVNSIAMSFDALMIESFSSSSVKKEHKIPHLRWGLARR